MHHLKKLMVQNNAQKSYYLKNLVKRVSYNSFSMLLYSGLLGSAHEIQSSVATRQNATSKPQNRFKVITKKKLAFKHDRLMSVSLKLYRRSVRECFFPVKVFLIVLVFSI